jgi:oxygen-independent coproporphyrinogen-3 oxidase
MDSLGIYISIPFCKAKCSFCNFASGVFAEERMDAYVNRILAEIQQVGVFADHVEASLPRQVDSIYLGGGTPSLLPPVLVRRLFAGLRSQFTLTANAEVTVECAPGQLSDQTLEALQLEGMNRLSFGVQSFVDRECAAVGRLHTGAEALDELRRVSSAGVRRVGVDLIAGLPHQTETSWRWTVEQAIASEAEHVSVYMLEVDEDSRLGREALAGGTRYGAGALPVEDRVADWYASACDWLEAAGIGQYEISNFAHEGGQSRHNRKYWERAPYVGFGMDAHSMLRVGAGAVRWANADSMSGYLDRLGAWERTVDRVSPRAGFEEALFLGLRLLEGVSRDALRQEFYGLVDEIGPALDELSEAGLLSESDGRLRLTANGRMVSNEVFERLLLGEMDAATA